MWTDDVVKEVLPNGLTLLIQPDANTSTVAVVTHVKAGYFDEPDEWVGIAHVLEHMFFKGTRHHGPGVLARETQRLGGYLNAGTIYDKTIYYTVVPASGDGMERALQLQADALRHLALDPHELEKEIEVIVQEAKRKLDTPEAVTGETLYELLFKVHRIRRWRIGTEAGLRRLRAADVRRYYESRYTPGRVIVALAGALDVDEARAAAWRAYADWHLPDRDVAGSPPEPPERPADLRVLRGDVERPLGSLGWRTVGARHQDTPALDLAGYVLGAGRGSWLAGGVRKPGLASGVACGHYTPGEVGVFEIALTTPHDKVAAAVGASLAEVARLREHGPARGDLERARSLLGTLWAKRFESADGRASTLAEFEALGDVGLADAYYRRIQEVSAAEVRDAAARYLTPDAVCAAVYVPEDDGAEWAAGPWPPRDVAAMPVRADPLPAPRFAEPGPASGVREVGPDIFHLATGGADVLVSPKHGAGLVAMNVHYPSVRAAETEETAGVTWLLARSALRGAAGLSGESLAVAAERLGGSVTPRVGAETVGWSLTVRADAAREGAALLLEIARAPTLAAEEIALERGLQANDAARFHDDMYRYPQHRAVRAALPAHVYGLPALGVPERVAVMDADLVCSWAERVLAARPVVTVVGDLDREALLAVGRVFEEWSGGVTGNGSAPPPVWQAGRETEARAKAQSALAMAFPGPAAASRDRFAGEVACAVLSGLAGRLFDELRERRALAYTVQAAPWMRRRAGAVLTYIATSPDREDEAREAMLAELARLAADPIGDEELERARNYAAGLVAIRRQHASSVATEIGYGFLLDTLEDLPDLERQLREVTAEQVAAVSRTVFDPARRAEFVVRGVGKSR